MRLIFVGAQGSGKGTQAKVISEKLGLCHISTGDLLREVEGDLKSKVEEYMNSGMLVPDELIVEILKERIEKGDCEKGFILDGFPRNLKQAEELDKITKIDKIVEIFISDEEAIRRIINRLNCKNCGAIFNTVTNPPEKEGICDNCNSELIKRSDDTEQSLRKRLEIYHRDTKLILGHYDSVKINGEQPIEKVTEDILEKL